MAEEKDENVATQQQASVEKPNEIVTGPDQTEETFIDPGSIPDELKPHWKRMHGTFTKRMQEFAKQREKVESYDRFFSDAEFARATVLDMANRLGLRLTDNVQEEASRSNTQNVPSNVPLQLVEAVKRRLPSEVQWMADSLAAGQWEMNKLTLEPLLENQQRDRSRSRETELDKYEEELSAYAPGWQEKEDQMVELLDFLQDREQLSHPQFGSKMKLLYDITTGGSRATQEAINRFSQAAKGRSTVSTSSRGTTSNLAERIKQAKTEHDAWEIAADDALQKVGMAK